MDTFTALRTPMGNIYVKERHSVLWSAMISQRTQRQQSVQKRICFIGNFYARNSLAQKVCALTQGEVRIIGTRRANYVEGSNRDVVLKAREELKIHPELSGY